MRPAVLAACADLAAWSRRQGLGIRPRLLLVGRGGAAVARALLLAEVARGRAS